LDNIPSFGHKSGQL